MSDCEADDEDDMYYKPGLGKFINTKENVNTSPPQQEMVIVQIPDDSATPGRKRRLKATVPASSSSIESRRQKAVKPNPNV
jgi:hypothetical protein